jgi:hypothetical protein
VVSPDNIAQKAVGDGPFEVAMLYHDGEAVREEAQERLANLIEARVVSLALGATEGLSP